METDRKTPGSEGPVDPLSNSQGLRVEVPNFETSAVRLAADSERPRRMFETVLSNTPDFIYVFGLDHRVLYANEALLKVWGCDEAWAVGKTLLEIGYEPWHAAMHDREIEQVRSTGQPIRGEVPFTGTNGRREYDYIFVPVFGAGGEVEAVAGTTRDVTERKEIEDQLRRNHDTFFGLIENNPFGMFAVDGDFRLRQVSLGAQKVFETIHPLLGRDFAEILRIVWPEPFASEALGHFRHTLETGEPYSSPSTVARRADIGEVQSYDWRIERFCLPDGRNGVVCYFYDLSERQRWEASLLDSEQRLRLATDAAQLGIWTLDRDDDAIVWENDLASEIFGLVRTEAPVPVSRFKADFLLSEDVHTFESALTLARAANTPLFCECRIRRTNGDIRWVEFTGRIAESEASERLFGTVRDITERKKAEQALQSSEAQHSFAVKLADALRPLSDPIEVQAEASRLLGEQLSANRVVYFEITGDDYVVERDYFTGVRSLVGRYPVSSFGPALLANLLAGRTVVETDATLEPDRAPNEQAAFAAIQVRGHVDVPLVKEGRFLAGMTVHVSDPRDWTQEEVALIEETAERTWAAVERVRAEAALRRSEERSAFVRQSSGVGVWYCDLPFDVLDWDELVKTHFHLPADTVVTIQTFYDRLHPDDREQTRQAIEESIRNRTPFNMDYRTVNPETGAQKWIRAIGRTFYASDGTPTRFDGVTLDVSDRKREEQRNLDLLLELENQHEFVKAVISQVPAAIVVADTATGQIRVTNEEAHRIVKHEYQQGKRLEDYGTSYIKEAFATDGSRYGKGRWPLDRALLGETIVGEEIENVMFDGSHVIVRVNAGPIRVGGKAVAAVVAFHDITERRAAERAARFLADASAALSDVVDYEHTLQRVAHLAVPGFADWAVVDIAEEGDTARRLVVAHADPAKANLSLALHNRFSLAGSGGMGRVFLTGRSGMQSVITDEMLVAVAKDEGDLAVLRELAPESYIGVPLIVRGKPLGVMTFLLAGSGRHYGDRDLEVANDLASRASIAIENAQLYERLRQADRRKDEFLATLAHELRNPLAPIRSGLDFIRMSNYAPDVVEKTGAIMERQLNHMVRLVDDLMDVSRINSGKLVLQKKVVPLASVVDCALESSRPLIEQMGHALSVDLPAQSVMIDADLTRLAQVLSNLLNNSAKYTKRGGRIWLTAERTGNSVTVSVKDNGIGIASDQLPQVFEMFSQVTDSLDKAQGGLGIGLMLVRRLVEMHGGTVEARSDGLGKGAEFVLHLPVVVEAAEPHETRERESEDSTTSLRILVVDDNQDVAFTLVRLLEIKGNTCRAAYSGEEAISETVEFRPDVILMDIGLPKMSGYEACRQIRQVPGGDEITIIAQSGWSSPEDKRRSLEAGFDHHLVKPCDLQALSKLLKKPEARIARGVDA